MSSHISYVCAA